MSSRVTNFLVYNNKEMGKRFFFQVFHEKKLDFICESMTDIGKIVFASILIFDFRQIS